jgi:RNA polymerase sigma-70 factor (ECF subfamily)
MSATTPSSIARAREEFLALAEGIRPELHRYCARLTGSVIDGEDLVQEALARAFYASGMWIEPPPLRPWLFRIAHNAAVDQLKSHRRSKTELHPDVARAADAAWVDEPADPAVVRAALARFLALPVIQRSAVILKDVLGHSLEETAATMETTVMAVKAALVRGRRRLRELADEERTFAADERANLQRYAALFNARDWEGVRALVGDDCRLDLVSKAQRQGPQVGQYFGRYDAEQVAVRPVVLEGRLALAAYVGGAARPSYFILLTWEGDRVTRIDDFRYVPYIAVDADFRELDGEGGARGDS